MRNLGLSYNSRKALMVQIGEAAGAEIGELISEMAAEIEELRRTKVSVTQIVPEGEPARKQAFSERSIDRIR